MSDRYGPILVFRLGRINLIHPIEDAALEVQHLLEPHGSEKIGRLRAADARFALSHDLQVRVELVVALRDVAQWNQQRPRNSIDLILMRLAHVDEEELVAAVEAQSSSSSRCASRMSIRSIEFLGRC